MRRRRSRKNITPQEKEQIKKDYKDGLTISKICEKHDIAIQTVYNTIDSKPKKKSGGTEQEYKIFTVPSDTPKEDNVTDLTQKFTMLHRQVKRD